MSVERSLDSIPEITMEALITRYEVLLFDAYGVLVHSSGAPQWDAEYGHDWGSARDGHPRCARPLLLRNCDR